MLIVSIVSFITVRYLLSSLGEIDFGLYNLIGGIVILFSFISASMSQSSQRFISLSLGKNNQQELQLRYKTAILLHLILALIVTAIIQLGGLLLINHFLDIPTGKHTDALFILATVTLGTFFTIIRVPYDAILMAYENILYVSVLQTAYSVLRLIGILLLYLFANRLYAYAILMLGLSVLYYIAEFLYIRLKYVQISPKGSLNEIKKEMKSMMGFTGVYIIGAFATTIRDQGLPIVLNNVFGVIINASTAIATQINGIVNQFSSTIGTAIRPQLIKSVGADNKDRLNQLSFASCKYPSLSVILVSVPLIVSMGFIQNLWLKTVPEYAIQFAQIILLGAVIQQLTLGLTGGIDATGKIKTLYYTTAVFKIIVLPILLFIIKHGGNPIWAYGLLVISEIICAAIRCQQAAALRLINLPLFLKKIICPIISIFIVLLFAGMYVWSLIPHNIVTFLTYLIINTIFSLYLFYTLTMTYNEKIQINNLILSFKEKYRRIL